MPIKVNQTPGSSTPGNHQAFVAGVHVTPNGTVGVTYYDFRNNDANPGVPTDYWIVHCHAACASPGELERRREPAHDDVVRQLETPSCPSSSP